MKYKFSLAAFLLVTLVLAAGCGLPEKIELSERLIIEAVGVDCAAGGFAVTVQALDTLAVESGEDTQENGAAKCYTFHGTTVGEALAQIAPRTGLVPLYSQARLLVLGFSAAQEGLCESLDFFLREHHTRADITVAVAEHTAQELLTAPFGNNRAGADLLQDALEQAGSDGEPPTPLYRFMNLLLEETDAAFCPLLGLEENPPSDDQSIRVRGAVLFQGTKIRTVISADGLTALRALTDGLSGDSVSLGTDGIRCTLRIARCKTKIRLINKEIPCRFRIKRSRYATSPKSALQGSHSSRQNRSKQSARRRPAF